MAVKSLIGARQGLASVNVPTTAVNATPVFSANVEVPTAVNAASAMMAEPVMVVAAPSSSSVIVTL